MKRAGYSPWVCKKLDTTERLSLSLLGFPESQLVKNPPAIHLQETPVRFLRWEDPLEKGRDTHSSYLAWRIPWTV